MSKHHKKIKPSESYAADSPEENLLTAVIRQAWCDALCGKQSTDLAEKDIQNAKNMFEKNITNNWRQALQILCTFIDVDDEQLVVGYKKYKDLKENKQISLKAEDFFNILLKKLKTKE
jgi:hypothetical protein